MYLPNLFATQDQIFKRNIVDFDSEFSIFKNGSLSKAKLFILPYYLPITKEITEGFLPF